MASVLKSTKYLRVKRYQFYTNCQKIEEEGTFPSSFYEVSIALISKAEKDIVRKKPKLQMNNPVVYTKNSLIEY